MTEAQSVDPDYTHVDPFALEDDTPFGGLGVEEEDQTVETVLIKEIRQYLKEAKAEHNSFDIIDLTEQAKMSPTQQIAMHKCVVQHLRNIEDMIKNKVKEN